MPENILNITQNKGQVEVKLKGMLPGKSSKILFALFIPGILIITVVVFFIMSASSIPIFFRIGFPLFLFLGLIIISLSLYQTKNMTVYFSRKGNQLHIKSTIPPFSTTEEKITINKKTKFVLVKFLPLQTFGRYQLLLENGNYLEIMTPRQKLANLLTTYPVMLNYRSARKFLYVPENARQISKLLKIPLTITNKNLNTYVKEFKAKL